MYNIKLDRIGFFALKSCTAFCFKGPVGLARIRPASPGNCSPVMTTCSSVKGTELY